MQTPVYYFSQIQDLKIDLRNDLTQSFTLFFDKLPRKVKLQCNPTAPLLSVDYLLERERIWEKKLKQYGPLIWNGIILTVEGLQISDEAISLQMACCEYKDYAIRKELGLVGLKAKFGSYLFPPYASATAILITKEKEIAFGVIGDGTFQNSGTTDLFGGSLNQDEQSFNEFSDIEQCILNEIKQEVGLTLNASQLRLIALNCLNGSFNFRFISEIDKKQCEAHFSSNHEIKTIQWQAYDALSFPGAITHHIVFLQNHIKTLIPLWDAIKTT